MIGQVLIIVVIGLVAAGLVAPGEALMWWRSGRLDERLIHWPSLEEAFGRPGEESGDPIPADLPAEQDHYLVYLSGIGISSPAELPVIEIPMVERLTDRIGGTRIIWQIYPYSAANTALTQGRRLSRLWQVLARWKFEKTRLRWMAFLINLRNSFQIFVSSDRRYGPVFNLAIAEQIAAALIRNGYRPEHRHPVTLLGWSGGAQIAAGTAWYLAALGMPVRVMSMAGIMSSDPGLDRACQIWHLRGDHDKVQSLGALFSAGRWPIFRGSSWNRARREGRLRVIRIGPLKHAGKRGYFSCEPILPDSRQPCETTADAIVGVLVEAGLARDNARPDNPD